MDKLNPWDVILRIWQLGGDLTSPAELAKTLEEAASDPLARYCAELALDLSRQGLPDEFLLPVLKSYAALLDFHRIIIQSERNEQDVSG